MRSNKLLYYRIMFVLWSITILVLTSIPKLRSPTAGIIATDKLAHFFVYLVFAFLFVKISRKTNPELIKTLFWLALTVPLADELHQIPIPGREFSIFDVIADMLGFLLIILLVHKKILQPGRN